MKSERWKIAASVLGSTAVLTVFGLLLAGNPPEPKASAAATDEPPDELLALARCLASESSDPTVQIAIGWIVLMTARRRKVSIHELLTAGLGYGPQKVFVEGSARIRFASTDQAPTQTTLLLAQAILAGQVAPPTDFTQAAPTSFVHKSKASKRLGADGKPLQPETTAARILALQSDFGGLVGRIGDWFFYRHHAAPVAALDGLVRLA